MSEQEQVLFIDKGPLKTKKSITMPIWLKALIALLPALIFLVVFTIYPIFNTTIIAFIKEFTWRNNRGSFAISNFLDQLDVHNNWESKWLQIAIDNDELPVQPLKPFFTFENFGAVLKHPDFIQALLNTAILTIISVPLTILISLFLAVSLNSIKPLRGFFQTVFFLPYVTNSIALGMVFNTLFSPQMGGIMNQIVTTFGGTPRAWILWGYDQPDVLVMSRWSLGFAIILQTVWSGLAFKILVFMSGLASIDKQYYDAARIDGANRSTIMRRITVPLLSPQILYITITSFIGAFKAYQSVISIVAKGPLNMGGSGTEWLTVVGFIYKYRNDNLPFASAAAVLLLIIILLITLVQMQVSKRRVHY